MFKWEPNFVEMVEDTIYLLHYVITYMQGILIYLKTSRSSLHYIQQRRIENPANM